MSESKRSIPRVQLTNTVRAVDPDWDLHSARLADSGYLPVYHLAVETPGGVRECVLKATPETGSHGVDLEARLLRILGARTSIPPHGDVTRVHRRQQRVESGPWAGRAIGSAYRPCNVYAGVPYCFPVMPSMTAELSDGTRIKAVQEVVEGSNGVHLKRETGGGMVERVAYVPYPELAYVFPD